MKDGGDGGMKREGSVDEKMEKSLVCAREDGERRQNPGGRSEVSR